MVSKTKPNVKKPFWKKYGPEVKHMTDHLGHVINNSNAMDMMNAALYAGTSMLGMVAFNDIRGGLIGPIGLKLATSPSNIAAGAGVGILSILGLATVLPQHLEALQDPDKALVVDPTTGEQKIVDKADIVAPHFQTSFPWALECPEGYKLVRGPSAAVCVRI